MHILLANQWYPPESGWGGVATYNYFLARAYRNLGHTVTVLASRFDPAQPAIRETDGIRVHRLLVRDAYPWRRLPILGRFVRPIQQLQYARRVDAFLRELHRDQPFDAVEFAEVNAEGFCYARSPQAAVVVRCHTPTHVLARYYTAREMPYDTALTTHLEKNLIRRAHALTAPSRDMARVIAETCNVPLERIAVVPNALDPNEFSSQPQTTQPPNHLTILFVGRLERVKGVTILARAIPSVVREFPNAHFVFLGEDVRGTRGELEKELSAVGALSNVEFVSNADHAALLNWYQRADICVVPSLLYESFSYTCAQAMAMSKAVVASRIGGIPETVDDGVNGIVITPGNADELAQAILRLAHDPGLRERMGRAGRAKVEREFDARMVARQAVQVFAQAQLNFVSKSQAQ